MAFNKTQNILCMLLYFGLLSFNEFKSEGWYSLGQLYELSTELSRIIVKYTNGTSLAKLPDTDPYQKTCSEGIS
ncbi:unnamed protein product [Brassica napus]|uniref:Uncharacterized protein n=2 Tax=Brassica TaxID=3705 RepID=A0A3P6E756_BRAOL|nr:unnamed protein product [Brassica napus]VDD40017.1 unnamed protein product [Brassica oleracea]